MVEGKYFEDYSESDRFESEWKTVTESQFSRYVDLGGIHEPLFEDIEFVTEEAGEDDWIVPGFFTMTMALGLFMRSGWFTGTGLALVDTTVEFEQPVTVGDSIRVEVEVDETVPTSKPEAGVVKLDWTVRERDKGAVASLETSSFLKKRAADDGAD